MAQINQQPELVREYWPRYRRRAIVALVGSQTLAVSGLVAGLVYFRLIEVENPMSLLLVGAAALAFVLIALLAFISLTRPLKIISDALTYTAGEQTTSTPPHLNNQLVKHTGLRPLLETIYRTGKEEKPSPTKQQASTKTTDGLTDAINQAYVGLALMDDQHHIIFANAHVPLQSAAPKDNPRLELEFYTDTSLDEWLAECEEKAVNAKKTWSRVVNKPAGAEGRKFYDIVASYHKGSKVPVSLVFVEKTEAYAPEDDDLNFIAFAAHELRGPVTVIRGYLDTLNDELQGTINLEQQELFLRLIVSANRLSSYINNILNSARYDRRHLQVHLVETTIADIYHSIADDMEMRASSQQRLLSIDLPAHLPSIAADPASIGEVLGNLIDNAVKYSSEGGVIRVSAEQKGNSLEVEVEDHGIGMPANVLSNLFHKFYRSHRSRETVAGTGIGLYISKAIVESHGGTMAVRSVEGSGSTFSFTLPLYASVADKLQKDGGDNRVLISNHSGSWIKNHGTMRG